MTLFICGVIMAHYAYHNMSEDARHGSVLAVTTFGIAAEAFLYSYLGLCVFSIPGGKSQVTFSLLVLACCVIVRIVVVAICILCRFICNKGRINIGWREIMVLFYSGLIRGQ